MAGKAGLSGRSKGESATVPGSSQIAKGSPASQQILATRTLLAEHHCEDVLAATSLLRDVLLGTDDKELEWAGTKLLKDKPELWLKYYREFMDRVIGKPLQRVEQETKDTNISGILEHLNEAGREGIFEIAARFTPAPDAQSLDGSSVGSADPDDAPAQPLLPPRDTDGS